MFKELQKDAPTTVLSEENTSTDPLIESLNASNVVSAQMQEMETVNSCAIETSAIDSHKLDSTTVPSQSSSHQMTSSLSDKTLDQGEKTGGDNKMDTCESVNVDQSSVSVTNNEDITSKENGSEVNVAGAEDGSPFSQKPEESSKSQSCVENKDSQRVDRFSQSSKSNDQKSEGAQQLEYLSGKIFRLPLYKMLPEVLICNS